MFKLKKIKPIHCFFIILVLWFFLAYKTPEHSAKSLTEQKLKNDNSEFEKFSKSIVQSEQEQVNQMHIDLHAMNDLAQYIKNKERSLNQENVKQIYENERATEKLILEPERSFLIVEHTKVFREPKFCSKTSEAIFNSKLESCEFSNCFYTCDTKEATIANADAFLFHLGDLEEEYKSTYQRNLDSFLRGTHQFPETISLNRSRKNPNQVWILWNDEANLIDPQFNRLSSFFNWTMSYKSDAEIYEGTYGFFKKQKVNQNMIADARVEIARHFKAKKNAILWFVTNCKSPDRIRIALDISKYYPVNVYGKCDILAASNANQNQYTYLSVNTLSDCPKDSQCEKDLLNSHKYYLAFENRNCTDYITEKFWRSLRAQLIPIVFQPNRESYSHQQIPASSYIHLQDFGGNAEALGKFLTIMDKDYERYYGFLKWTNLYLKTYDTQEYTEPHRMCQLCKRLNTVSSNIFYKDLNAFFTSKCDNTYQFNI